MTREVTGYWCEDCERKFYLAMGSEEPVWCSWCRGSELTMEYED